MDPIKHVICAVNKYSSTSSEHNVDPGMYGGSFITETPGREIRFWIFLVYKMVKSSLNSTAVMP